MLRFKDDTSRSAFYAAYDTVLAQWPVGVESIDARSDYGTTHVQVCGPRDGGPLVLLHGGGATSTVWFANVEDLARTHRVYAVDQIGDAGRSVLDGRPIDGPDDLSAWLDGLLDALGLDAAALAGHSYGAWIALLYATRRPQRVSELVLIEPTQCFAGMSLEFRLRAVPLFARPSERRVRRFISWETAGATVDPAWLTLAALAGGEVGTSKVILPRRPAPAALSAASMPTLVLTAENSRQHDVRRLAANARRFMPNLVTATLAGQSHFTVPSYNPQELNTQLVRFLG